MLTMKETVVACYNEQSSQRTYKLINLYMNVVDRAISAYSRNNHVEYCAYGDQDTITYEYQTMGSEESTQHKNSQHKLQ